MARARSRQPPRPWTVDEFLEWERQQPERYEYVGGMIVMMVGGTLDHNVVIGNIYRRLREGLRGSPCRAYSEAVKVRASSATVYPDVVVSCGPQRGQDDVLDDAAVVVEVLSRSTQGFDRGAKWDAYQELPSLRQYVLVSQDQVRVQLYERTEGEDWRFRVLNDAADTLAFAVGDCTMTLAEIYEETSLDPKASSAATSRSTDWT
jgi:Uma2 family endonuclease